MTPHLPPPLPTTIDEVVARLDAIVAEAIQSQSRLGYFAALYNRVTMAVRDGIHAGAFDDNERMARLDVVFANRYIAAYEQFRSGGTPSLSWRLAFAASPRPDLSVLQHLLLGMNAHINFDLGLACVEIAPGPSLDGLEGDFNRINDVLGALMPTVELQLTEISALLGVAVDAANHLDDLDDRIGNFSMREARRSAWRFAKILAAVSGPIARDMAIKARDLETSLFGSTLQKPGPLNALLASADWTGIAAHIRILARGQAGIALS